MQCGPWPASPRLAGVIDVVDFSATAVSTATGSGRTRLLQQAKEPPYASEQPVSEHFVVRCSDGLSALPPL